MTRRLGWPAFALALLAPSALAVAPHAIKAPPPTHLAPLPPHARARLKWEEKDRSGSIFMGYLREHRRLFSRSEPFGDVIFWDVATGKELSRARGSLKLLGISLDGKVARYTDELNIVVEELATEKVSRRLEREQYLPGANAVIFSPDSQSLLLRSWRPRLVLLGLPAPPPSYLQLYDQATGKMRWEHRSPDEYVRDCDGQIAFSPDGKVIAATADYATDPILLLHARTGAPLRHFTHSRARGAAFAFSPDSRLLVVGGGPARDGEQGPPDTQLRVWEHAGGKELLALPAPVPHATCLALSRNGRHLAIGTTKGPIILWDLLTNREAGRLAGHRGGITSLAFSPDGCELASGSQDTTILIWYVATILAGRPRQALSAEQVRVLWSLLAEGDALQAYRAAWVLADAPEQTLPFLASQLRPARLVAPERFARLLVELAGDTYGGREKAAQQLAELDQQAVPVLQAALSNKPSLELAIRARRLLEHIDRQSLPARQMRALGILEDIGSPSARRLLQELADGAPDARLTRHARAALARCAP